MWKMITFIRLWKVSMSKTLPIISWSSTPNRWKKNIHLLLSSHFKFKQLSSTKKNWYSITINGIKHNDRLWWNSIEKLLFSQTKIFPFRTRRAKFSLHKVPFFFITGDVDNSNRMTRSCGINFSHSDDDARVLPPTQFW